MTAPARALTSLPLVGCRPMRGFSWHRSQRHRGGLQFMVSTGCHHGYEALAEARLLTMLDFAGEVIDVLSQPMRLRFSTEDGAREHIPDFLADTTTGRWLIDVHPAGQIQLRDEVAFAATAQFAELLGWGYMAVTGWRQPALATVDTLSSQRRPLADPLGMAEALMTAVAAGPCRFDEARGIDDGTNDLESVCAATALATELGLDLSQPLDDQAVLTAAAGSARRVE
ncbi:TnsA-like heteromeric transposase endonuclease subunit [Nocardia sp. KC 131]|uniref:TnsA-like heteromeric transposase endonuclease subunit n=1 Tax=Nocardia arseniciresistens TaxID=3392119 RepID=UPI00398E46D7